MSAWLIGAVGLVYLGVAIDLTLKGNWGMAIAFGGYAVSNVGLYMAVLRG